MRILAADTTTSINTVALCDGDQVLAETFVDCGRRHSERLMATVDWILKEAGMTLDDVHTLAISAGPGSFTGLRVGAAAWKGLALAKRLPLVAVPTLDAMTRLSVFRNGVVCPLIDAKMGEVFGAVYQFSSAGERAKLRSDRVCAVEQMLEGIHGQVVFLGDGAQRYRERIEPLVDAVYAPGVCSRPRASAVAAEALHLLSCGVNTDPALVAPVYLREAQAVVSRQSVPTP